ncbi:hypothetical protein CI109_106812 [Kwoniella shandongensis]|uniref:Uncharacterized protein n=1 Tax=Kwoniella shandongensis TaxID=1734106 RepID=A0A5M6C792_9TREE|nr:uncharacterized protein CI109_000931 [Kwoniella shandongensis]KAA5530751.1 hypothetical protein CI109_000931 [Kwoniella shandongensis]
MQSLLGGADCSTSSNPLKQVLQREGVDNSLFKDRLASVPGPSSQSGFRPSFPHHASAPAAAPALHANPTPHPFNLSHLSAALSQTNGPALAHHPDQFDAQWDRARVNGHVALPSRAGPMFAPPGQAQGSGSQQQQQWRPVQERSAWSNDFQSMDINGKGKARAHTPETSMSTYQHQQQQPASMMGMSSFRSQMPYQPSFTPMYNPSPYGGAEVHGQSQLPPSTSAAMTMDESKMEELFARAEEDWMKAEAQEAGQNGKTKEEEAVVEKQAEQEEEQEVVREAKGDFDAVWESLRPEAERLGKLAEWEKDFSQFTNDEDDLFETLNESLNRPDVGQMPLEDQLDFGQFGLGNGISDDLFRTDDGVPSLKRYEYASPTAHDNLAPAALWAEANHILSSGGPLSTAATMLESFIRRATSEDREQLGVSRTEAWSLLGRVHAMDEKEEKALAAFDEGRKVLEEEGVRGKEAIAGEMLTNLAISYVNESLDLAALTTLHQFLRLLHPAHAGPAPSQSSLAMDENTSPWSLHQNMTNSFLALAREQYQGQKGTVDPDVQVGLGTLYYMMGEYGQARDCWVAALGERPDDYLLWNRLGATLANGGSSEEAVDAYRRALELKPTFTRAIFNLGVACLNIGVHKEAAEHFLAALSLHPSQRDSSDAQIYDSGTLWSTLRRSLVAMDMPDLADKAKPGTDLNVFRQAGFEF